MPRKLRNNNSKDTPVINDKIAKVLQEKGLVVIRNMFPKEECNQLAKKTLAATDYMQKGDMQCPRSYSMHSDQFPAWRKFHQKYTPAIAERIQLPIKHSYAYGRIYSNGETLKSHTDRPACELSATLTLKKDEYDWPLFIETRDGKTVKINLEVGDCAIYYGRELAHWREPYEGQEQVQLFLHWVYSDELLHEADVIEFDSNEKIRFKSPEDRGILSTIGGNIMESRQGFLQQIEANTHRAHELGPSSPFLVFKRNGEISDPRLRSEIDDVAVKQMIKDFKSRGKRQAAGTGTGQKSMIRSVYVTSLEETQYTKFLMHLFEKANSLNFHYRLTGCEPGQLCEYRPEVKGKYDWHPDSVTVRHPDIQIVRKLSMSILLTPRSKFRGGDLQIFMGLKSNGKPEIYTVPLTDPGDYVIFDSTLYHRVTPITAGRREAMVTWCQGPHFI